MVPELPSLPLSATNLALPGMGYAVPPNGFAPNAELSGIGLSSPITGVDVGPVADVD
jgi:hypothetical protein